MNEIKLKGLNETIYEHTTKEGLKVYMWVNEKVNSTLMTLSVKYGSIHTKFKIGKKTYEVPNGIAHFLEHIKFNIDESTTAHDEFYKLGGDANAFTTFKYTSYIVFATQKKQENLKALLDFVYNPYFTNKMISKEKGIIIEEANMGTDDAYTECFYRGLQNVLQKAKFRNLITGNPEEIKSITLEDIKLVYNCFYHPQNMFLCITGNFNPYEMAKIVDDDLSQKEFDEFCEPVIIKESEPKKVTNEYDEVKVNLTYPIIKYSVKLPLNKFKNTDLVNLKMICNLIMNINFGATSDFKEELVEKGLIIGCYYNTDIYDDYLVLSVNVTTNYKDEVIERIKDRFINLSIPDQEIKRKKNANIATLILDFDDVENVNMQIQDYVINYDGIVTDLKLRLENMKMEDIKEVMDNITLENVAISVFLPKENQES